MPCEVLNFSCLPCSRRLRLTAWRKRQASKNFNASLQIR
ncbi:hypothetical protein LMG23992_00987 [Cupriavidus laharis]|uniref:Uncharacterized protein n=1 Tax=Cupriavidus laharis TaxID=151654 RepID=A0ABN7Y6T8_9BURK|nr:hypothetical protein LMG23992_00987 [Cupriavidus laharis]